MSLIVIVDDDPDDTELLMDAIKEYVGAAKVSSYTCPVTAINELKSHQEIPTHIFLDINMPKLNGFECLREFRSDSKFNQCSIAVLSTFMSAESRSDLKKSGADFAFKKPSRFKTYKKIVEKVIQVI